MKICGQETAINDVSSGERCKHLTTMVHYYYVLSKSFVNLPYLLVLGTEPRPSFMLSIVRSPTEVPHGHLF